MIKENFFQALANLYYAKLRSFLAVLGIMVGTASVVALVSSGELATKKALAQFQALGTDLLAVSVFSTKPHQSLKAQDTISAKAWLAIKDKMPSVEILASYTAVYEPIAFGGYKIDATIVAADNYLADVINIQQKEGRFLSYLNTYEKVCVIGHDIALKLKAKTSQPLIGQQLFVGSQIYTIIGVVDKWTENSFFNNDVNKAVFIPLRGVYLINQNASINSAILKLKPKTNIEQVISRLQNYLLEAAPGLSAFPRSAKQIIQSMESQGKIFTLLLGLIGGISLLVGGIGVMNVMLVSVMERKREIGIRKAIGAKRRDIAMLFLMEAVVLALFGGALGVLFGLFGTFIICFFAHWSFEVFMAPLLLGFLVSALTGIFFGFYPALRASNLQPIECLRVA